jgi:hypothetical protein
MSALLGVSYDSSDDDATAVPKSSLPTATKVVAAPEVNTEVWSPLITFLGLRMVLEHELRQTDKTNNPIGPSAYADDPRQRLFTSPYLQCYIR